MALNNVRPVGDDQRWKQEVEKELDYLKKQVALLIAQSNARNK